MSHYYRFTINMVTEEELDELTQSNIAHAMLDRADEVCDDAEIEVLGSDSGSEELPE